MAQAIDVSLSPATSVQDNAAHFFERAKKLRKKAEGARLSVKRLQDELAQLDKKHDEIIAKAEADAAQKAERKAAQQRKTQWFEKFHWFRSSEGFLCVGGRDASTNEIVIKKHTNPTDVVFHTEAPGSPFFVIQTEGKKPGEETLLEAAQATASYSRAWKLQLSAVDSYWVNPDQLSKTPNTGESLGHGAFVVRGRRNTYAARPELGVGVVDAGGSAGKKGDAGNDTHEERAGNLPESGMVMGGPVHAIEKHCSKRVTIRQGDDKPSDAAKKIAKLIGAQIDDVLRVLPSGGIRIVEDKTKKRETKKNPGITTTAPTEESP